MARPAMVTRTIKGTNLTALMVDINAQLTYEHNYTLSRTYKDSKSLLKALEKVANDDTHKVVKILSSKPIETLYGMDEQKFISNAEILPPRKA